MLAHLTGRKGPSGFGSGSTAYDVAKEYSNEIKGKVVLVTGANSGIGVHCAKALAEQGATVVLACRSKESMAKTAAEIRKGAPDSTVHELVCDLGSLESVRKCAAEFKELNLPLNVLINNAGVMVPPFTKTVEGYELQFGTNHLGHYALTNLLADKLKEGAPSRVVNVASTGHRMAPKGGVLWDDLKTEEKYNKVSYYGQSKLCNMLHALELNKRAAAASSGITAVSLHPGVIFTNLGRHLFAARLFYYIGNFFAKSEPQGAATSVYCAFGPVEGGSYYSDCNKAAPAHASFTPEVAEKLWTFSAQATGTDLS